MSKELADLAVMAALTRKWRLRMVQKPGDANTIQTFVYYQGLTDRQIDLCKVEIRERAVERDQEAKLALCNDQSNTAGVTEDATEKTGGDEAKRQEAVTEAPAEPVSGSESSTEEEETTPPTMTNTEKNAAMKREARKR